MVIRAPPSQPLPTEMPSSTVLNNKQMYPPAMFFSQHHILILKFLLLLIMFFSSNDFLRSSSFSHVHAQQPTTVLVPKQSAYSLSTTLYNYGLFNLSYTSDQPLQLLLAHESTQALSSDQLGKVSQYAQTSFDGTFRITPLAKSPNDRFRIVLNNVYNEDVKTVIYRFSDVVFQSYERTLPLFMPSQSIERLHCSNGDGKCANVKSKEFYVSIGPSGSSNSSVVYYPMKIQFRYSFNDELSDSNFVQNEEIELSSEKVTTLKTFTIPQYALDRAPSSGLALYMSVKCLNPSGTVCNLAFSLSSNSGKSETDIPAIVGGSIGITVGVSLIVTSVVTLSVVACCIKKRKAAKKAKLQQNEAEMKAMDSNPIQIIVDGKDECSHTYSPLLNSVTHQTSSSTLSHQTNTESNMSVQSLIETYRTMSSSTSNLYSTNNQNTIGLLSGGGGSQQSPEMSYSNSGLLKERYKVVEKIGNGAFGDCYLCHDTKKQDSKVAIKSIKFAGSDTEKIISECSRTATIQHERLVQVHELFISKELQSFCMVMKFYEGDLEKTLYKYQQPLSEKMFLQLMKQLGEGLDYLHSVKQLVHRDIKPRNVFVEVFDPLHDLISVVVGDLGEAKELLSTTNNSIRGTLSYMSPEVIAHEKYGFPSDIFSLGVSLYQIMTRDPLETRISIKLLSESEDKVLEEVKNKMITSSQQYEMFYDSRLIEFICQMLRKNPHDRPTAKQIKEFEL